MKQEVLTLEQGLLADTHLSLKESHRKISRFMREYSGRMTQHKGTAEHGKSGRTIT